MHYQRIFHRLFSSATCLIALVSFSACNLGSLLKRPGAVVSEASPIVIKRPLSASVQTIADHGGAGMLALAVGNDGSLVDPRRSFRVRVQLHSEVDLNQISEKNVSVEAIGTDSVDSATVEVVGDTIQISHEGFFGVDGADTAARFCIRLNDLVDLQGNVYEEHRVQFSRNLGDIDGNGVSREESDYNSIEKLFFTQLSSSSSDREIRSDISGDGLVDIFDFALYVSAEAQTVPATSTGFCQ